MIRWNTFKKTLYHCIHHLHARFINHFNHATIETNVFCEWCPYIMYGKNVTMWIVSLSENIYQRIKTLTNYLKSYCYLFKSCSLLRFLWCFFIRNSTYKLISECKTILKRTFYDFNPNNYHLPNYHLLFICGLLKYFT